MKRGALEKLQRNRSTFRQLQEKHQGREASRHSKDFFPWEKAIQELKGQQFESQEALEYALVTIVVKNSTFSSEQIPELQEFLSFLFEVDEELRDKARELFR